MNMNKAISEVINFTGIEPSDFKKSNIPTGRELSKEEKVEYMKRKRIAKIMLSISVVGLEDSTSSVFDEFNLHVENRKHEDNLTVLNKHLEDAKSLMNSLLINWEKEI